MSKTYEVWSQYKGEVGIRLFSGNKWQCNAYIRQAVKKGATPDTLVIREA